MDKLLKIDMIIQLEPGTDAGGAGIALALVISQWAAENGASVGGTITPEETGKDQGNE